MGCDEQKAKAWEAAAADWAKRSGPMARKREQIALREARIARGADWKAEPRIA